MSQGQLRPCKRHNLVMNSHVNLQASKSLGQIHQKQESQKGGDHLAEAF